MNFLAPPLLIPNTTLVHIMSLTPEKRKLHKEFEGIRLL